MKNNKKGFTLIELLAVIVILAIIALIATPIVLNIISKARKSAAQDSVYGMMSAIEYAYFESLLDSSADSYMNLPIKVKCTKNSCNIMTTNEAGEEVAGADVKSKGTQPTAGTFILQGTDAAGKEGQFKDVAADDPIVANGFNCTITNQVVSCEK